MALLDKIGNAAAFLGAASRVSVNTLRGGTVLRGDAASVSGRRVLLACRDQFLAALAMIELDGVASRLVLGTPDLNCETLRAVLANADIDTIVTDVDDAGQLEHHRAEVRCGPDIRPKATNSESNLSTEWVLLTSGTSGAHKMIVHTLATLTAPIRGGEQPGIVWGTFYDLRRYGGLQILLRAVLGNAKLVIARPEEKFGDYLLRLAEHGVTHQSGTPSHWRRVLMSPQAARISPRYIRLSGEIVDQGILNALRDRFPHAAISHAFASTEAGVGFEVTDVLEGFPSTVLRRRSPVEVRIRDGSLRIRSAAMASRLLTERDGLRDEEGFIDTGDVVESRGDRYYFLGRRSGVINVGGFKVYPEEVEMVINRHPAVLISMVRARRNSIAGSLVTADVVLTEGSHPGPQWMRQSREILQFCHNALPAHKVPATIRCVSALEITHAGKLARTHA